MRKSQGNSHVTLTFPVIVTSLDSTDNKRGVQQQVRRCRQRRNFVYYIGYFRKATGILLQGVWCKNILYNIPIITLVGVWPNGLSSIEKLGHPWASPRVTLLFSATNYMYHHSLDFLYRELIIWYHGTNVVNLKIWRLKLIEIAQEYTEP